MDQRTSPTRRFSRRQFFYNLPEHRKREIISRQEWTTSTSLSNLPGTRRLGGRNHSSDNEGIGEADDVVGEGIGEADDEVGEDSDDDDDEEDEVFRLRLMQDQPRYDSDGHEVISDFVSSDQVDEEDEEEEDCEEDKVDGEDEEDEEDEDDDKDSDVDVDVDDVDIGLLDKDEDEDLLDEDEDEDKDEDEDDKDEHEHEYEDEDAVLDSDAIYSATTVEPNYEDDHLSLTSNEEIV